MSSSEVGAPTSDSSVTEEVKEASTESTTKPDQKDDNSSEASPKKVTSNSTTTAMDQNGEDRPTSPTEEAGLKTIQAKTETDCVKDEEYTSSEAKHNGVDEDKEKSEKETEGVFGEGEEGGADGSGVAEEDESGGEASAASGGGGGGASPSKPAGSSQHNNSIVSGTSEASSLAAPAEASGMGALEGANGTGSSDEAGKTAVTSADGLTVDDLEDVLLELNKYEKQSSVEIPSLLESYLKFVAKSGSTHFPWNKIKRLFRDKLEQVFNEFFEASPIDEIPPTPNVDIFNFANVKDKVFEQLESFAGIPFTIQRIAELLTTPKRHYRRTDKFMRALEKNMLVVSHTEPRYPAKEDESTKLGGLAPFMNGEHSTETTAKLNTGSPRRSSSGGVPILVRSGSVNAKRDLPMTSSLAAAERTAAWASQASAVNSDAAADTSGGSTDCSRSSPAGTGGTAGLSEEEKERLEGSQISTSTTEEDKQTSDSESKLKRCDLEERESGEDNEAGTGEPAAKRGKMDSEAEKSDPDGGVAAGSSETGSEEEKEVATTPAATTSTDGDSNQSKATTSDSISSQESVANKEESVQENGNQTSPTPSTPATGKENAVKNGSTEDSEDKNGKSSEKEAESSVAAAAGDHSSKTAEKIEKSSDEMEVDTECSSTESGNILQVE